MAVVKALRWSLGALALLFALIPGAVACALGFRDATLSAWCRFALRVLGVRARPVGPMPPPGSLVVFNHVSYLDILAVGALCPGRFVAKREIARWPLIGWGARLAGTLFVDRESPRSSRRFLQTTARCLERGERVLLFPEGGIPGGDGTPAPFRPMFFQASVEARRAVVPAALVYRSPADPSVWAWTDSSGMLAHLTRRVFPASFIEVEVRFGAPIEGGDRKDRAQAARQAVMELAER